ncbi:hypothetical protein ACH3XW_35085 [Acanthocheilonema viteae]
MTSFLIKQLLLLNILSLAKVLGNAVTEYPFNYRTGKLNQFVGFGMPRSPPPTNGPFIYGSIWASWSAWSFCVNKVRVRVRACNTVRGFSCLGKKQEFMECDLDYVQPAVHESDYAAVDPWEEDRKEAMKQLYSQQYLPDELEKNNSGKNKIKFAPHGSEIRRRERMRMATKGVDGDQTGSHKRTGNEEQTTSILNTENSNAKQRGQSLLSSPLAEITTRAPFLTDAKLERSNQQQQVPSSIDQTPVHSVRQSPVASESSLLQSVHHAPQVSLLPQSSPPQSPDKPEQVERSVLFTATERILIDQTEDQVVSSKGQEVVVPAPPKILVWMPPGITTWVAQETSNNNTKFPDFSTTTPNIYMLNLIASESSVPQDSKIATGSSSTSLPPSSPTTPTTTKMPEIEVKIPSDYQSSIRVPVAKALIPVNTSEKTIRNNKFPDKNSQFVHPRSNTTQAGFKTLEAHSSPLNQNDGILLKKFDQLLGEDRQGASSFDILPEQNIEGSSNWRYAPRLESQLSTSEPKTYVVDQSRMTLQDGEVDFNKAKDSDRAAADKALDLLLKAISSDDIDEPNKKLLPNKNSYFDQPSSKETELDEMREKVESLEKAMKAMEETLGGNNKVEAYRKAMNLNLVPRGPSTSTSFPTTAPTVIDQSRIFLVAMNDNATSNWSEWTDWQRCFCGKQIRTRICHYETSFLVKGCKGKSYESRPCNERNHCPTTTPSSPTTILPISTSIESKFRRSPLHQPLSIAVMQKANDIRMKYFIA